MCDQVDRALDRVRRLRPAGAAVGVHHARVRVDAEYPTVDGRDPVRAREHACVEGRRDARRDRGEDTAEVGVGFRLQRRDRAVALRADLEVRDVVAAVRRRGVVLTPRLDPLHRPAQFLGERRHQHVLRVQEDLRPERAADGRRDAAHLRLGDDEVERRHQQPHHVRRLRANPDGVAARQADIDGDHHEELPPHEEGNAQAGDEEHRAQDHREAERHVAGGDRAPPLGGVATVGLHVGRVVQVVGAAGGEAEGHEGQQRVDEHVAVREDAGRAGRREHEHVLRPLLRTGGAHEAPETDALHRGVGRRDADVGGEASHTSSMVAE